MENTKTCRKCLQEKPRTDFYKLSSPQYKSSWDCRDSYCIPCRKKYSSSRRIDAKKLGVEYLGGKCVDCGMQSTNYVIYDFHHIDVMGKDFTIGKCSNRSFKSLQKELDKCILLCSNCHRIRHYISGGRGEI